MKYATRITVLLDGPHATRDIQRIKNSIRPYLRREWLLLTAPPRKEPPKGRGSYPEDNFNYRSALSMRVRDLEFVIGYVNNMNGITYIDKSYAIVFRFRNVPIKPETITKYLTYDINRCKIEIIEVE